MTFNEWCKTVWFGWLRGRSAWNFQEERFESVTKELNRVKMENQILRKKTQDVRKELLEFQVMCCDFEETVKFYADETIYAGWQSHLSANAKATLKFYESMLSSGNM